MRKRFPLYVILVLCLLVVSQYKIRYIAQNDRVNSARCRYHMDCDIASIRSTLNGIEWNVLNKTKYDKRKQIELYKTLQDISVRVDGYNCCGTGILFSRKIAGEWRTFVWTAGHVVYLSQQDDGTFDNLIIHAEVREEGKFIKETDVEAKVIAYSNPFSGEDLALLEILESGYSELSAEFASDKIQQAGIDIIHVGATIGLEDSVSLGIISQTDREYNGKMYDQTSCMAYPGSSGGGIYTADGKCVGIVTLSAGPGLNFFVPMRRIRTWAKEVGVEWALDNSVEVPLVRKPTALESIPPIRVEIVNPSPDDSPE